MSRRLFRHNDLATDSEGHVHSPPPLLVGYCDRLRHVIGIVAAVLSGLETQPGAVAVRILRAHGVDPLLERLWCVHARLPSFANRSSPRVRNPDSDDIDHR